MFQLQAEDEVFLLPHVPLKPAARHNEW